MNDIVQWVTDNRQWIFSGIGVAAISTLVWLFRSKARTFYKQIQKSGDHSFNVQAGRDAVVRSNKGVNREK